MAQDITLKVAGKPYRLVCIDFFVCFESVGIAFRTKIDTNDFCACCSEPFCDRSAYSGACACNDDYLVFKTVLHPSPFWQYSYHFITI